jgi:hypothetical protein
MGCLPAEKFPTPASLRRDRGLATLLDFRHPFPLTRPRDVAGGRITGIRGWICATSSLGSPVIIVQVRSHSPDSGSFHPSPKAGKGEGPSVFHSDRERQLRSGGFSPFVESVRRNQAASFYECFPERRRFIDGLGSGVDGPVSDLRLGSLAQCGINPHCKASSERAEFLG